jgi:DNA-binding XRE family transcriptional regulator
MFEIGKDFKCRISEKRGRERLSICIAAEQIGISRRTLSLIEADRKIFIKKTVYKKIVDWLVNEKIYKEG